MKRYRLNLHTGSTTPASALDVDLEHDGDASDLAEIALLSTAEFTHAEVYRDNALIAAIARDSYSASKAEG